MCIYGSNRIHGKDTKSGEWILKSQNFLKKAICNFNVYLLTNFKSFQNKDNTGSVILKLKTNKCSYYPSEYDVIRTKN